jgi:hypothetical protein
MSVLSPKFDCLSCAGGNSVRTNTIFSVILILISAALAQSQSSNTLATPQPKTPSGPSPRPPVYEWTEVEGAEFYIIKNWGVDEVACKENPQRIGLNWGRYSPHFATFQARGICVDGVCTLQRNPLQTRGLFFWNPRTGNPLPTGPSGLGAPKGANTQWPEMDFARRCGPDGHTYNGDYYVWSWSVQAARGLDKNTHTFADVSAESPKLSFTWDEHAQPPTPTPAKPKPAPSQDHPVTFINQSGMTLFLYYFIRPMGATVDCHQFAEGGTLSNGATSRQFVIPAKQFGRFIFQKSADGCTFDQNFTSRDVPGGNPKPETIVISR